MHHKRKRQPDRRAGCGMCKPHKMSGWKKRVRLKGLRVPRVLADLKNGRVT